MRLSVDTKVFFFGALVILIIPLKWLIAALIASSIHELGHILAVKLLGGKVYSLHIGAGGAIMEASPMTPLKNILCSAAGPVLGLLPVFFSSWFPRTALCALVYSAYNLLPLMPLDGGRALDAFSRIFSLDKLRAWITGISITCLIASAFIFRFPLLLVPILPAVREKYLAMQRKKGYNSATIEMR